MGDVNLPSHVAQDHFPKITRQKAFQLDRDESGSISSDIFRAAADADDDMSCSSTEFSLAETRMDRHEQLIIDTRFEPFCRHRKPK